MSGNRTFVSVHDAVPSILVEMRCPATSFDFPLSRATLG
jgi:hypothetical protein